MWVSTCSRCQRQVAIDPASGQAKLCFNCFSGQGIKEPNHFLEDKSDIAHNQLIGPSKFIITPKDQKTEKTGDTQK